MDKEILYDPRMTVIISIPSLKNERWVRLNRDVYPLIKPVYWISSKARIYNAETGRFISTRKLDKKFTSPYYKANLQITINNHSYSDVFLVHRLMMCSFYPIKDMDKMYVNHKDGNKFNDDLSNLEWTTPSGNTLHALKMGLFTPVYGENHVCATITDKDAEKILDLLFERKYTHFEISEMVGTTESIVDSIASGKAWKHISKKYDLKLLKQRLPKLFTMEDIYEICRYFENNPKEKDMSKRRYCMRALDYINYKGEINESALNAIRVIYEKKRYRNISKDFNF